MHCLLIKMLQIKEIEKNQNKFLKRTDLFLIIDHKGKSTPSEEDIVKEIAKKYKADEKKIEINYIFSEIGKASSRIKAKIWKDKIIERKKKEEPSTPKEPESKEEIPKEPVKEENPAEEVKKEPEPKKEEKGEKIEAQDDKKK